MERVLFHMLQECARRLQHLGRRGGVGGDWWGVKIVFAVYAALP